MIIEPKFPDFSGKKKKILSFFCASLTVLIALIFFVSLSFNSRAVPVLEENLLVKESLPIFNQNTLIPVADPAPESKIVKKITVVVTAYSSTPWETQGDPFITAAGTQVRSGIIANNLLSFGTKIKIPELYGEKVFVVEDRMNSRKSNYHIDIWFPSHAEALNFGAKKTYIEVLEG